MWEAARDDLVLIASYAGLLTSASFRLSRRRAAARAAGASGRSLSSAAVSFSFSLTPRTGGSFALLSDETVTRRSAGRAGSAASSPGRPETYAYAPRLAPAASARTNGETPPRFSGGRGVPEGTEAGVPRDAPPPGRSRGGEGVAREEEDAPLASAEDADGDPEDPEDAPAEDDAEEGATGASAAVGLGGAAGASPGLGLW